MPPRPSNPSFYVVNIPDRQDVPTVARAISIRIPESGSPLAPLGGGRYVIARPAVKYLQALGMADILNWLMNIPGVALVRRLSADEVVPIYNTRDPAEPGHDRPTFDGPMQLPWHYAALKLPEAWDFLSEKGRRPLDSVRLGHLDTGFTPHPAFGPWLGLRNPHIRADLGVNYREGGQLPLDPAELQYPGMPGHGTRTGSVIAADNPEHMLGVAHGVSLVPYRVTNIVVINFAGNVVPLGDALVHAVDHNDCEVINISLGDPCSPGRDNGEGVDHAYEKGVIVVAAAGNITSEITYPGRHARTITAGGVARDLRPWVGGSRGREIAVCAPADEIFRAAWAFQQGKFVPVYGAEGDGTSFATAHISGIACLWLARWGDEIAARYGRTWRRVEAFRHVIRSTAFRPSPVWDERLFGAGIIDAAAVLQAPLPAAEDLAYIPDRAADDCS